MTFIICMLCLSACGTSGTPQASVEEKKATENLGISVRVISYAITDFQHLLEDRPPEFRNFTFTRILDTEIWAIESTQSNTSKAQEEIQALRKFLREWGQKAAGLYWHQQYPKGAIISFMPAVLDLGTEPSFFLKLNEEPKSEQVGTGQPM